MDPNATLAQIRHMVKEGSFCEDFAEIAELIEALDEWLSKGGYLPAEWQGRS